MAKTGDIIENPITGERITFLQTAADTGGERLVIELSLAPSAHNAAAHLHDKQLERIRIDRGELRIVVGDAEPRTYRQGEECVLEPGVPHVWWNESGEQAQVTIEYEPALKTEQFFESFFALARAGRTDDKGVPRFLQLVLMSREYDIYDGGAPVWLQKLLFPVLGPLSRALGNRAHFVEPARAVPLQRAST